MPVYPDRAALQNRPESDSWVQVDDIEIFTLGASDRLADDEEPLRFDGPDPVTEASQAFHLGHDHPTGRRLMPKTPQERVIVLSGEASFESANGRVTLKRMQWIDVPQSGAIVRNTMPMQPEGYRSQTELARISGHWEEAIRTAVFKFGPGHPCDYHYHDGDEYWFVFRGHFTLLFEGVEYDMKPGSVLAAGMGEEHGVVNPSETFEGVGFATKLEGQLRDGHLWRAEHGDPVATRKPGHQAVPHASPTVAQTVGA